MKRLALVFGLLNLLACSNAVEFHGPNAQTSDALPGSLTHEFPAAELGDIAVILHPERQTADQQLALLDHPVVTKTLKQVDRAAHQDQFTQGHDGQAVGPENFGLTNAGLLDLVVVVDNSTSMDNEQALLSVGLTSLLSKIGNTDWRIKVVSMSDPCARFGRIIKKSDVDKETAFANAVNIPLDNTIVELGFPMAIKALKGECKGVTTPWLRPGSAVGVLILSDEDNCGSNPGEGCPGMQGETAQQMVDFLASIRPPGQARVYGIFEIANECGAAAYAGTIYKQAADLTQGAYGSICQASYATTLQAISDQVNRTVKREFTLGHVPDPTTLKLAIDGVDVTSGYTMNGTKLSLDTVDVNAVQLSASYIYGATPKTSTFTLKAGADAATLVVKKNSQVVDAAGYTYDTTTHDVVLVDEPADDAQVSAAYRQDDELPLVVAVGVDDMLGAPTKVLLNGQQLAATDVAYDAATDDLTFQEAPGDGAEIKVTYTGKGGLVTSYPAALEASARVEGVTVTDDATGAVVPTTFKGGNVVFDEGEIVEGRLVTVHYDLGNDAKELSVTLANEATGSLAVEASGDNPAACTGTLADGVITVDCGAAKVDEVTLSYQAVLERHLTFTLPEAVPSDAHWHVFADGVELQDGFTVSGSTVSVAPGLLGIKTAVKVVVDLVTPL